MAKPIDKHHHSGFSDSRQQAYEKNTQLDDLHYLSSVSFDAFHVTDEELENLNKRFDSYASASHYKLFQTIFISILCGLLIGISLFFIVFHKNQNHPSVWQILDEESPAAKSLNNPVHENDTVFPLTMGKNEPIEHFHTSENQLDETETIEPPDMLSVISNSLNLVNDSEDNDIVLQFIPNAPVIFIHQMKITNYRGYYFKQSQPIDLDELTGLSAEYESLQNKPNGFQKPIRAYLAYKIIKNAMRLFSAKQYSNCIEDLTLLYNYNKDDANAQFYLGMCYFLTGKYSIAQNYFQQNLDNQNNIFHQESEFYQSLCLLNLNQKDKALNQLKQIVTNKGFYSTRAQETLNKELIK